MIKKFLGGIYWVFLGICFCVIVISGLVWFEIIDLSEYGFGRAVGVGVIEESQVDSIRVIYQDSLATDDFTRSLESLVNSTEKLADSLEVIVDDLVGMEMELESGDGDDFPESNHRLGAPIITNRR